MQKWYAETAKTFTKYKYIYVNRDLTVCRSLKDSLLSAMIYNTENEMNHQGKGHVYKHADVL